MNNDSRVNMWSLQGWLDRVVNDLGVQTISIQRTTSPVDSTPHYTAVLVRIKNIAMGDGLCVEDAIVDALDKLQEMEGKL